MAWQEKNAPSNYVFRQWFWNFLGGFKMHFNKNLKYKIKIKNLSRREHKFGNIMTGGLDWCHIHLLYKMTVTTAKGGGVVCHNVTKFMFQSTSKTTDIKKQLLTNNPSKEISKKIKAGTKQSHVVLFTKLQVLGHT
jgi:hypothetical protein